MGFFFLGLITLINLVLLVGVIMAPNGQLIAKVVLLGWMGILVWPWYIQLWKRPFEFKWVDGDILEFRNTIGSNKIRLNDLISIKVVWFFRRCTLRIKHPGGSIMVLWLQRNQSLDDFLKHLQASNSKVKIEGF